MYWPVCTVYSTAYSVLWSCVKKPGAVVVRVRLHKKVWEKNTIRGGDQQRTIKNRAEINPRNNNINQCNVLVYSRIITSKLAQYDPFCKVYVCKSKLSYCTVYYYTYFTIYNGPSLYISRHLTRSYAHFADLPAHLPIALPLSSFNFTNKKTLSSSF